MAAEPRHVRERREAVNLVLDQIFRDEPAISSADALLEFTRRSVDGRNFRIKRQEVIELSLIHI